MHTFEIIWIIVGRRIERYSTRVVFYYAYVRYYINIANTFDLLEFLIALVSWSGRNFLEFSWMTSSIVSREGALKALRSIDPAGSRDKKKGKLIMKELPCMRRWDKNIRDEIERSTRNGRRPPLGQIEIYTS